MIKKHLLDIFIGLIHELNHTYHTYLPMILITAPTVKIVVVKAGWNTKLIKFLLIKNKMRNF